LGLTEDQKTALRAEGRVGYWRFRLDQNRIEWPDGILGQISIDAASVSDPVLIRADGQVLYTFASVVDDTDMAVTHIVRGSDHVTNTATQIQIMAALGFAPPEFAHHSLLTGPGGEGLSKRLGSLALRDLRDAGVEPMALLSLMARLGASLPVELRSTHQELIDGFDVGQFGAAPTKFDADDLTPLTARAVSALPYTAVADHLASLGLPADRAEQVWTTLRANLATRAEAADWVQIVLHGPVAEVGPDAAPNVAPEDADFIATALALLPDPPYGPAAWADWTDTVKTATGRKGKTLFRPLRLALTGREKGPEMADFLPLLTRKPGV
jgi:glutamyl-tRNA synthetase